MSKGTARALLARKSWRAGGVTWTVARVERVDGDGACGQANFQTQTIEICVSLPESIAFRTLLHELAHAAGLGEEAAEIAEVIAGVILETEGRP